jgi:hypothetical protein
LAAAAGVTAVRVKMTAQSATSNNSRTTFLVDGIGVSFLGF